MTRPTPDSTERHAGATEPIVIGWREYVAIPEWGIKRIRAKSDTGARTSSIDVTDLEELETGTMVRFRVALNRRGRRGRVTVEAPIVRRTRVRASTGQARDRLFVSTVIRMGDQEIETELGLVSRQRMLCRMLLGRSFLSHGFFVDSATRYRVSPPLRNPM